MRTPTPGVLASILALILCAAPAIADELPRAKPAEVGLSAERLAKIDEAVGKQIEQKTIPGAITVVARNGKVVHLKAYGSFKEDSIIRIYSMSKPVTTAAALILVDDGKLKLEDPVSKYIPALAECVVMGTEKKAKPMTVADLCQHTAGMTYGFFGNTEVDRAYRSANILSKGITLEEMADKLCKIPLQYEPGSRWHYSVSIDVLGRVIEVASGKPFDVFLQERLFGPLGMKDTAFHVPKEKADRFVPNYGPLGNIIDDPKKSDYLAKPKLFSGGGGLVSTAADYTRFLLMMSAGGKWKGKQIISTASVKRMTTNQLPKELVPIGFGMIKMPGTGFGLGVSVKVSGKDGGSRVGDWGWGGAASTTFFVSPSEGLVFVNMLQRMPMWTRLDQQLRPLVYEALEKREPAAVGSGSK